MYYGIWNVFGGCQAGHLIRLLLSSFLKTTPDKIVFHPHYVGGGFGGRESGPRPPHPVEEALDVSTPRVFGALQEEAGEVVPPFRPLQACGEEVAWRW